MEAAMFQKNKVRRMIRTQGSTFQFVRKGVDDFGEPNSETVSINVDGVYHEVTSFLTKSSSDSTTIRKKPHPMILCLWEDAIQLQHTDMLSFNGKTYTVGEIVNLSQSNIAADISLEEVQYSG